MYTIFSLFKGQRLPSYVQDRIRKLLVRYQNTADGIWLRAVNIGQLNFYMCSDMTVQNGILGAFSPLFKNNIYLMGPTNLQMYDKQSQRYKDMVLSWYQSIITTVIHQLRHKYQSMQLGMLYTILAIPFIREYTIQPDARSVQKAAQDILQPVIQTDQIQRVNSIRKPK